MLRVKICGLTNLEDARAAIQAGADMLGFNFYPPSPRSLAPETCAQIIADIDRELAEKEIISVGVFVNLPPEEVRAILMTTKLDLAQLSGDEPPSDLHHIGLERAFKVIRAGAGKGLNQIATGYPTRSTAPAWLVDASVPGEYGGTGVTADWRQAAHLAAQGPIILAGGLSPDNIAAAVREVKPWGVDVASGVESAPAVKDGHKMRAFIQAARSVNNAA